MTYKLLAWAPTWEVVAFSELLGEEILWGGTWNTVLDIWLSAAEIVSRLENP